VPEAAVVEGLDRVPEALRGVILANELLDNLPAALAVRIPQGWEEQWVGVEDGELVPVGVPARPAVAAWADAHAGEVPVGSLVEVQIEAGEWVAAAVGLLEGGALVVIDYGDTAEGLLPRRAGGTLRTYRAHHLGPDPLLEPGATDITMDVDFAALMAAAGAAGAEVSLHRQDDFLIGLGLEDRLAALRRRELELAATGDAMERLRIRSALGDGRTLLHPRGLGDFRVMIARV
ncbi:MAG: SAM-dependent methyltransferase, partial [Actinomycetota bacterium]